MLERARAGNRTVLGHMTHEQHRHVKRFRGVYERARHLAHLRGAAGDAIDVLRDNRLRRIHNRQRRPNRVDQAEHGGEIGGRGEQQVLLDGADA